MIRPLIRLVAILGFVFAIIWGFHTTLLLKTAKRSMAEEGNRSLMVATQSIFSEIEQDPSTALSDVTYLRTLGRRYGVFRISILDREGVIITDTDPDFSRGDKDPLFGTTQYQLRAVYDGAHLIAAPYTNRNGEWVRSFFLPAQNLEGSVLGVLRVNARVKDWEKSDVLQSTSLLMRLAGGVILLTFLFYLVRWLLQRPDFSQASATGGAGTAAVIETFHGLVRKLKEKESELEQLRTIAEKKAEDFESYNENILQSVSSGVITFNSDRVITSFNQAAERILGVQRAEMVGKSCEEAFGLKSPVGPLLTQALKQKGTIARQELELERGGEKREGDKRIWVGVSTSLLRDHRKKLIGTTFVFSDLTEIKNLQEQVELNRRLTVLGEMSAGIAHEFRNYMGTVMGFTKLLSKKIPPGDAGEEMVESIIQELKAMNVLIEQLLGFGRHDEVNLQPVDLEELVRAAMDPVLSQTDGEKPEVHLQFPPGMKKIRVDGVLMRQAIGNLISNAVEAMPTPGKLNITAKIEMKPKTGSPGPPEEEILLEIEDTGTGIPKEKMEKIFLPFFTTKEKGTGMGLALVHKIIQSHGGRIEVRTWENEGTSFRIRLPIRKIY